MQQTRSEARNVSLLLEVILFAGLFVRLWGLSGYAYNPDEMQFLLIAKGATLSEIWHRGLMENHPPLLHFLRHYLLMINPDIFFQRLLSIAAGLIAILGMYHLGRTLRGQALGVFLALGMAFAAVAVSSSMMIRDYAFFMMFELASVYFFVRYQSDRKNLHLLGFAFFLFIACATSFGGFLLAAACAAYEGLRLLKAKQWKKLLLFCCSFLPLALLGLLFYYSYMLPGEASPMWKRLAIISGFYPPDFLGRLKNTGLNLYYFFVPFGGIRSIPGGMAGRFVTGLMLAGSFCLIALQAKGLGLMRRETPPLFGFIVALWGIALAASLAGLYPLSPSRQNFYLLPFFILPYGYVFEPLARRILFSYAASCAAAFYIVIAGLLLGASELYIHFADELSLQQKELTAGQDYLTRHIQPGDAIVTGGSAAYFYLLDAKENGGTGYNSYSSFPYFNNTTVLSGFDAPFKPHASSEPVRAELQPEINILSPSNGIWFVMYGWKNIEIWHIMECTALAPHITDFFSRDGVIIFRIGKQVFSAFLNDKDAWDRCFLGYKPLVIGTPFHAMPKP